MARKKSNTIARLTDLLHSMIKELETLASEQDFLIAKADRLDEIEPALNKLKSALTPPPPATDQPATDQPATDQPATDPPASIPKKRREYIRKHLKDDANIPDNPET